MPLRIAIIDDEPAARATLRQMLQRQTPTPLLISEAESVRTGLELLAQETTDLLLLDVEMEDGTGFDLLDQLLNLPPNVVFCTAHNEFAIRAFRYNAIDYLLKPVLPEALSAALEKARTRIDYALWKKQIQGLLHTAAAKSFDHIILPSAEGPIFLPTQDIVHIESYGNYSFVFLTSGKRVLASRNLKEFEEMLPNPLFFRSHQSHIIQVSMVKQLRSSSTGNKLVVMQTDAEVPVARRKKDMLESLLGLA